MAALVRQKIALGLLPKHAEQRLPPEGFKSVKPVLAVANVREKSGCWGKLKEVTALLDEPVPVVEIKEGPGNDLVLNPCVRHT